MKYALTVITGFLAALASAYIIISILQFGLPNLVLTSYYVSVMGTALEKIVQQGYIPAYHVGFYHPIRVGEIELRIDMEGVDEIDFKALVVVDGNLILNCSLPCAFSFKTNLPVAVFDIFLIPYSVSNIYMVDVKFIVSARVKGGLLG